MSLYFKIKIDTSTIKDLEELRGVELKGDYLIGYESNLKFNIEGQGISILEDMEPYPLLPSVTKDDFSTLSNCLNEYYDIHQDDDEEGGMSKDTFHRLLVLLEEMQNSAK